MKIATDISCEALATLIERMLIAETRTTPPPAAEAMDWLYGSAGFSASDENGWVAPLPSAHVWTPRALVFWRMAVRSDGTIDDDQARDPRYSLARWPTIEAAVLALLARAQGEVCGGRRDGRPG